MRPFIIYDGLEVCHSPHPLAVQVINRNPCRTSSAPGSNPELLGLLDTAGTASGSTVGLFFFFVRHLVDLFSHEMRMGLRSTGCL